LRIIGLTGGIGTGKSTVSSIMHTLGAKIIDADIISRQITGKDSNVLAKIRSTFGEKVISENGELNRVELGKIVFSDKEALDKLNAITHPVIGDKICCLIDEIKKDNQTDTIVVDAAIPFVHGFRDVSDEIWVVTADKEKKINRIMARNNLTKEEAVQRINSQISESEYLSIAHVVIENNKDITELEKRVVKQYYLKQEGASNN